MTRAPIAAPDPAGAPPAQASAVSLTPPIGHDESLVTVFTVLPRRLARTEAGQLAWHLALFVLLPVVVLTYWIVQLQLHPPAAEHGALRLALPIASIWVMGSPLLLYFGERGVSRWMATIAADADFGWNIERVRLWKRRVDRTYLPTALFGGLAAGTLEYLTLPTMRGVIPIPTSWGTIFLYYVFVQAGVVVLSGVSGVIQWVALTYAAVSGTTLRWNPFRPPAHDSVTRSYQLSLLFGLAFSCGALFLPTFLAVAGGVVPVGRVLIWGFVGLLLVGGLLIFTVPILNLSRALSRGKRRLVSSLSAPLAAAVHTAAEAEAGTQSIAVPAETAGLIALRAAVADQQVFPVGLTAIRAVLTTLVPIVSFVVSLRTKHII
jgi:hypothetical protein